MNAQRKAAQPPGACGSHALALDAVADPGCAGRRATQDARRIFESGAVRSADAEGTRFDLVSPIAAKRLAAAAGNTPAECLVIDAIRSIYSFLAGEDAAHLSSAARYVVCAARDTTGAFSAASFAAALQLAAEACHEGAVKYSDFNWEKGMPAHDLLNHAIRHLVLKLQGDESEPHYGHAVWNLFGAIHSLALWPELNRGHLRTIGCVAPIAASGGAA